MATQSNTLSCCGAFLLPTQIHFLLSPSFFNVPFFVFFFVLCQSPDPRQGKFSDTGESIAVFLVECFSAAVLLYVLHVHKHATRGVFDPLYQALSLLMSIDLDNIVIFSHAGSIKWQCSMPLFVILYRCLWFGAPGRARPYYFLYHHEVGIRF